MTHFDRPQGMETETDWPRDRGWSWVVLMGTMATCFLEMGVYKSFGIFINAYLDEFKTSVTVASLISGIFSLTFSFTALPITAFGTQKFGCRPIVMFGGFALFLAYLLSSIATNMGIVMLGQGVIGAIGSSAIHTPSLIILGRYFDKRRGFANGIAVAAGSLGGVVTPVVFTKLMEEYSIRGALLLQSAFLLHISLAAAFFRPTEFTAKLYHYEKMKRSGKKMHGHGKVKLDDQQEEPTTNIPLLMKSLNDNEQINAEENRCVTHPLQSLEEISIKQISTPPLSKLREAREHVDNPSTASQFSSTHSVLSLSVADIHLKSTTKQSDDKTERKCVDTLLAIMDVKLLRNKLVFLFTMVFCLGSVGTCLGVIFIPPMARDKNLTNDEIAITAALVGGSEFVFRIILGFVADLNFIERFRIVQISLFGTAVMLLSIPLLESFWHLIVFSVLFGFFSGPLVSMFAPVCIDFVGLDNFHRSMGILISFQGISCGGFSPTIGALRDVSGSYVLAFQVMAGVTLSAGLLLFFVPCLRQQNAQSVADAER